MDFERDSPDIPEGERNKSWWLHAATREDFDAGVAAATARMKREIPEKAVKAHQRAQRWLELQEQMGRGTWRNPVVPSEDSDVG